MKRAFLVLGAESSGTRLMTRILINAGCYGNEHHDQTLDNKIPEHESLIVWRRSVPHRKKWPDLVGMVEKLEEFGFEITVFIMSRDWYSMARSQVNAPHVENATKAYENISNAYEYIFAAMTAMKYELVNYEALTQNSQVIESLLTRHNLPHPTRSMYIYDGNAKYYEAVNVA